MGGRHETSVRAMEVQIRPLREAKRDLKIKVGFYALQGAGLGTDLTRRSWLIQVLSGQTEGGS